MGKHGRELRSLERLVLRPSVAEAPRPPLAGNQAVKQLCVFGPYHSCSNALALELQRLGAAPVSNNKRAVRGERPPLWKHRVFRRAPPLEEDALCICLVKDPAFWIQSLARDPAGGSFYDIEPVEFEGLKREVRESRLEVRHLFEPVLFDGAIYEDALCLWEAAVRSYFDEGLFPPERTAVVRCEDFLFRFHEVLRALAARAALPPA
mmetsp:Transcript_138721/g.431524  ORF Transcript_138721/g.431524 Transcript_138721/m.431524 type:complete len:207 (-) Transcript_138721:42-662(-)